MGDIGLSRGVRAGPFGDKPRKKNEQGKGQKGQQIGHQSKRNRATLFLLGLFRFDLATPVFGFSALAFRNPYPRAKSFRLWGKQR
jgi:hypothetical protein